MAEESTSHHHRAAGRRLPALPPMTDALRGLRALSESWKCQGGRGGAARAANWPGLLITLLQIARSFTFTLNTIAELLMFVKVPMRCESKRTSNLEQCNQK